MDHGQNATQTLPDEALRAELDQDLRALEGAASAWSRSPLAERAQLALLCMQGIHQQAPAWVRAACHAKGLDPAGSAAAEEISAGPLAVIRYLRLLAHSLREIEARGRPRLPGRLRQLPQGGFALPVFPTRHLADRWLFKGFHATLWLATAEVRPLLSAAPQGDEHAGVSLVLGAGNVSSIGLTDAFDRLFVRGHPVLLKMNPVNAYLAPFFRKALEPLLARNVLRIVEGAAAVGEYALAQPAVHDVHITGSAATHAAIVWGATADQQQVNQAQGRPRLTKTISSELGNVTPWIIVPGTYSARELASQAEHVAASIVNNGSFNCVATKVLVTWQGWEQRAAFLNKLQSLLDRVPPRRAYYPGAQARFARFSGRPAPHADQETLPWTLLTDIDSASDHVGFREESFTCVCLETALPTATPERFLEQAVEFANTRLWGTLAVSLTVPKAWKRGTQRTKLKRAVAGLNYGTVAINQWSALAFAVMSTPWGGAPGATLADPQSGLGWVHNTYLVDGILKAVLEGPLAGFPRPFWFPTHRRARQVALAVLDFYHQPGPVRLAAVLFSALRGG